MAEEFKPYIIEWEVFEEVDENPEPSLEMIEEAEAATRDYVYIEEITDLTEEEESFLNAALEYGWPMIERLHNFSISIEDILDVNYGTAMRVIRYNKRAHADDTFKDMVGYIGVYFEAIKMLQYKSKLVPTINTVLNTITYNT